MPIKNNKGCFNANKMRILSEDFNENQEKEKAKKAKETITSRINQAIVAIEYAARRGENELILSIVDDYVLEPLTKYLEDRGFNVSKVHNQGLGILSVPDLNIKW